MLDLRLKVGNDIMMLHDGIIPEAWTYVLSQYIHSLYCYDNKNMVVSSSQLFLPLKQLINTLIMIVLGLLYGIIFLKEFLVELRFMCSRACHHSCIFDNIVFKWFIYFWLLLCKFANQGPLAFHFQCWSRTYARRNRHFAWKFL